tara:strand:+ start:5184 stop:6491 length:1308 start_codon:yes stop_codon:yes gene_type:complete
VVFALALLFRGGVVFSTLHRLDADPDAYRIISETLSRTGVYGIDDRAGSAKPTAFRPPLYPYVLSWMVHDGQLSSVAVGCLHTLLAAVTVLLVYLTALRCFAGPCFGEPRLSEKGCVFVAGIAALLVAVDPVLLQQSTLVMTETMAAALAALLIYRWALACGKPPRVSNAAIFGVIMGLAFLCRPTFLVWAALMTFGWLLWPNSSWSRRFTCAGISFAVVIAIVLGWTARNQRMLGHPVWATTHGGYTLLLANNPSFYDYLRLGKWGKTWDADPFLVAYTHRYDGDPKTEAFWKRDWVSPADSFPVTSEVDDDRRSYEAARATIDRQPAMFAWSCLVRMGRLWSPLPHRSSGRSVLAVSIVGCYYLVLFALVTIGAWRVWRRKQWHVWWPTITLVIALSAVHGVYWSNIRMRAPAIPALSVLAAAAFLPKKFKGS